jgi:hypothetical protein
VTDRPNALTRPWNNTSASSATTSKTTGQTYFLSPSLHTTTPQMQPLESLRSLRTRDTIRTSPFTLNEIWLHSVLETLSSIWTSFTLWSVNRSYSLRNAIKDPRTPIRHLHLRSRLVIRSKSSPNTSGLLARPRSLLRSTSVLLKSSPSPADSLTRYAFRNTSEAYIQSSTSPNSSLIPKVRF